MSPSSKRAFVRARAASSRARAAALAAGSVLVAACAAPLPAIPVPRADEVPAIPAWYPEGWQGQQSSRVLIEGKIVFETAKATILPESEKVLQKLLAFLKEHPEVTRLRIEGHTDARASAEYNQELSARRSLAVCDWLVDHGIEAPRLLAVGFGLARPIAPNELPEGRAENRRTEFHVAELNGKVFGSTDPTAGGYVLEVLSIEQRKLAKERALAPRVVARPKAFKASGNETHELSASAAASAAPAAGSAPPAASITPPAAK